MNLKYLKELTFDEPIKYKELAIYPITMRDYIDFHMAISCLLLDKNSVPDVKVISMTYLRYLYYQTLETQMPYVYMLKMLLCMVLRKTFDEEINFYVDAKDKAFFKVDGIEYDASDFDEIVKIIFEQNCIEGIDETIQKEIRDELEKAKQYTNRQNQNKVCSLEEQIICVLISTPLKLEDIYNLTIRKFEKILERADAKLHYQIYLSASMSGFVEFKDKSIIKHWMSDLSKEDKYSDVKVDMDEMKDKINNINK